MSQDDITRAVIKAAGGPTAVGDRVGVSQAAVSNWIARGRIPEEHCPALESMCGGEWVCEVIRPDVQWTRVAGEVTGYHVPLSLPASRDQQQPLDTGVLSP